MTDLERHLVQRLPGVRLVPERTLSRALAAMAADGKRVPQNAWLPVWIDESDCEKYGLPPTGEPRTLFLIPPGDRLLYDLGEPQIRAEYDRLLDRALIAKWIAGRPDAELAGRFQRLPDAVRREVRFVLAAEVMLPADPTDAEVVRAFVPVYLDLKRHDPDAIGDWFPLLPSDLSSLTAGLAWETGSGVISAAEMTPDPVSHAENQSRTDVSAILAESKNLVRTAIDYYRRPEDRETGITLLREGLGNLLVETLGGDGDRADAWKAGLVELLPHTTGGRWTPATKALYELQALALDARETLDAVAPFEWLRSRGRRSVRQPLDKARDAILLRHLTKAGKQLDRIPLADADRHALDALIADERHAAEDRIHRTLGPIVEAALTRAGLVPKSRVERAARDKLVAELLDAVCGRGFFRLADLRDAVARNQLKLPDVAGPGELWAGDALLRADGLLGEELYGVYQPGEVYLRGIQRLSAAAFGTRVGRAVTLFALLPFLGAYLALEFAQHVVHAGLKLGRLIAGEEGPPGHHHGPHFVTWWSLPIAGVFFLVLLNSSAFRAALGKLLRGVGTVLGTLFVSVPRGVWRSRPVQLVVRSRPFEFVWQNLALPLLVAAGVTGVAVLYDLPPHHAVWVGAVGFLVAVVMLHTPPGRVLYERLTEGAFGVGRYVWASLLPGVVSWLVWLFREVAAVVERVLYAADEWLRFREGQSKESLALKVILAVVWFPIAYVVRFVFYLLVEPQVNPVKHFPVVTVSHKVIWPMVPSLSATFGVSEWYVAMLVNGVPGIFGFIAWELKENWRLYASNRPGRLQPAAIGHHGETVRGLLRPGFHAGTVPKLYRRLRSLQDSPPRDGMKIGRVRHELEHVADAMRHFVERELLPLLDGPAAVRRVTLGCQRIEVEAEVTGRQLVLAWELMNGEIVAGSAGVEEKPVAAAVAGLNALAAVERPDPPTWNEWEKHWG